MNDHFNPPDMDRFYVFQFHFQLKKMFSLFPRGGDGKTRAERRSKYEADRIAHAKRIMKPFFLRRLKAEVRLAIAHFPYYDFVLRRFGFESIMRD